MTSKFATFGEAGRFEIAVRWVVDSEPRERRPRAYGWSIADLRITVAGHALTANSRGQQSQDYVSWYLAPFFRWLTANWVKLLHEEDFAWQENSAHPAVIACRMTMERTIASVDATGRETYSSAQDWYKRHGLRATAEGGLFPDLFFRRLVDDIEISWAATTPPFAPDGFSFVLEPGIARLPVDEVAGPLWDLLRWFADNPPKLEGNDQASWEEIVRAIDALDGLSGTELETAYLPEGVRETLTGIKRSQNSLQVLLCSDKAETAPFLRTLSPVVAMFGGVSPNITKTDAECLFAYLEKSVGGRDCEKLAKLVENNGYSPLTIPHQDGLSFAEDLIDSLELASDSWIDVRAIVDTLGISVEETQLVTNTVRGVALAGDGFKPTIVVNVTSIFNASEEGKRFTIAHELCHILHDRSRARRVSHVSGPWVAQGFEKRANAFAAYLLMPRELVVRHFDDSKNDEQAEVQRVARLLRVNESALVEHLFNLRLIGDWQREALRSVFRPSRH